MARHERVIVDLGTGDGRAVLATVADRPGSLVIGIDANAAAMAESSRRAARSVRNGAGPDALFVVAAAEALPPELAGLADEVRILFPWGSLLRGVLGLDERVVAGIAGLLADGGSLEVLLSITPRDGLDGLGSLDSAAVERVAAAFGRHGVEFVEVCPVTAAEVRATRSTWARRLLAGGSDRPVWRLRFVRSAGDRPRPGPAVSSGERRAQAPCHLARDTMDSTTRRRPGARPTRDDRPGAAGR